LHWLSMLTSFFTVLMFSFKTSSTCKSMFGFGVHYPQTLQMVGSCLPSHLDSKAKSQWLKNLWIC
jgi:hypothetical protein